jgi:hypothetical protein
MIARVNFMMGAIVLLEKKDCKRIEAPKCVGAIGFLNLRIRRGRWSFNSDVKAVGLA